VIHDIEQRSPVELIAIGIGHDVTRYYKRAVTIVDAEELGGARICVQAGTVSEGNLADYFRARGMGYRPVVAKSEAEARAAYEAERCDVFTADVSALAASRSVMRNPSGHVILPDVISKEPLGPVVRRDDAVWAEIVRATVQATLLAEELGVTSRTVEQARETATDPETRRLLGLEGDLGRLLGLSPDWAFQVIRQVGATTWVTLNGVVTVDGVVMENFWNRKLPLPRTGPLQLVDRGCFRRMVGGRVAGAGGAHRAVTGVVVGAETLVRGTCLRGTGSVPERLERLHAHVPGLEPLRVLAERTIGQPDGLVVQLAAARLVGCAAQLARALEACRGPVDEHAVVPAEVEAARPRIVEGRLGHLAEAADRALELALLQVDHRAPVADGPGHLPRVSLGGSAQVVGSIAKSTVEEGDARSPHTGSVSTRMPGLTHISGTAPTARPDCTAAFTALELGLE
jgi:hypothetical protein